MGDLSSELNQLSQSERVRAALEVLEQDRLRREVERPIMALREREAVVVVRVVDPAARIGVLEPRTADVVVLLDDRERHPGLLQTVRGQQAGHARADDQHVEVDVGRELVLVPLGGAAILASVGELLLEQRQVLRHLGATNGELHDPQQIFVNGRRRGV